MIEELSRTIQLNIPSEKSAPEFLPQNRTHVTSRSSAAAAQVQPNPAKEKPVSPARPKQIDVPKTQNVSNVTDLPQVANDDVSPTTSSKKIRLKKLMGKLNKSLVDFFLKDGPEEISYVDDFSMLKHYNK